MVIGGGEMSELRSKKCQPCEGNVAPLSVEEARGLCDQVDGWKLEGGHIKRDWLVKDFMEAIDFVNKVAHIAETEDHHPDVHLTGYRNVTIELTTHAINGLSENDFILAAKIDDVPVELKGS